MASPVPSASPMLSSAEWEEVGALEAEIRALRALLDTEVAKPAPPPAPRPPTPPLALGPKSPMGMVRREEGARRENGENEGRDVGGSAGGGERVQGLSALDLTALQLRRLPMQPPLLRKKPAWGQERGGRRRRSGSVDNGSGGRRKIVEGVERKRDGVSKGRRRRSASVGDLKRKRQAKKSKRPVGIVEGLLSAFETGTKGTVKVEDARRVLVHLGVLDMYTDKQVRSWLAKLSEGKDTILISTLTERVALQGGDPKVIAEANATAAKAFKQQSPRRPSSSSATRRPRRRKRSRRASASDLPSPHPLNPSFASFSSPIAGVLETSASKKKDSVGKKLLRTRASPQMGRDGMIAKKLDASVACVDVSATPPSAWLHPDMKRRPLHTTDGAGTAIALAGWTSVEVTPPSLPSLPSHTHSHPHSTPQYHSRPSLLSPTSHPLHHPSPMQRAAGGRRAVHPHELPTRRKHHPSPPHKAGSNGSQQLRAGVRSRRVAPPSLKKYVAHDSLSTIDPVRWSSTISTRERTRDAQLSAGIRPSRRILKHGEPETTPDTHISVRKHVRQDAVVSAGVGAALDWSKPTSLTPPLPLSAPSSPHRSLPQRHAREGDVAATMRYLASTHRATPSSPATHHGPSPAQLNLPSSLRYDTRALHRLRHTPSYTTK